MAITFSTVIMAHPMRRKAAESLRDEIGELEPEIVYDPDPGGPPTALRTAGLAWRPGGATHHLVLQDDARPCRDFHEAVHRAVAAKPGAVLALFASWSAHSGQAARMAALAGRSWVPAIGEAIPAVAIVMPSHLAEGYAAYIATARRADGRDSAVMLDYLESVGEVAYVCVPGLVQHDDPFRAPLGIGHGFKGVRRSFCFAGRLAGPPRFDARPMAAPRELPYVESGSARVLHPGPGWRTWTESPLVDRLLQAGLPTEATASLFHEHLSMVDDDPASVLGHGFLHDLWSTAFMMGVLAGRVEDPSWRPVQTEALRTMAPGALQRVYPADALDRIGDRTLELLELAVREGVRS